MLKVLLFVALVTITMSTRLSRRVTTLRKHQFKIVDLKDLCPGAVRKEVHDPSRPCVQQELHCLGLKEVICEVAEPTCGAAILRYQYPKCKAYQKLLGTTREKGERRFIRQTWDCRCDV